MKTIRLEMLELTIKPIYHFKEIETNKEKLD